MIKYWRFVGPACLIVTAGMAITGTAVMSSLFLVELLVLLSLAYADFTGELTLARIFDLPVLVTARMAFSFGIMPLQVLLLMPEKLNSRLQGDYDLILEALLLVILGMVAFWAGCKAMSGRPGIKARLLTGARSLQSTLLVAVAVYAIGFGCKVYLLQHQLFAYTASSETLRNNLAAAQFYMFGASFATFGLLLICIEKFSHRSSGLVRWLFWGMALSECAWGLLSGMKGLLMINFLAIGAIATISRGKLAKTWVLCAVLGLVIVYPIFNVYRSILRGEGGTAQVATFAGAVGALSQAVTNFGDSSASTDWIGHGTDLTVSRLDLLQSAALILSLPNRAEEIQGDERLWMIPYYPFVPRMLWPSKPILNKGQRLNRVLGGAGESSDATPYVLDCYTFGGAFGVIAGMFALGLFTQRIANRIKGAFSKKDLFWYSSAFLFCFDIEIGVIAWWAALMKTMVVVWAIAWLAYGPSVKQTARTILKPAPFPLDRRPGGSAGALRPQYRTGS
jgi:hypothetical protein